MDSNVIAQKKSEPRGKYGKFGYALSPNQKWNN
jgi:hypothetical protein